MPRTYVKKTSRGNFNEEQLDAAINAVKEGKSIREAGRMFGIAESTIRLRMKRRCLKLERRIKQEFEDYTYYYKCSGLRVTDFFSTVKADKFRPVTVLKYLASSKQRRAKQARSPCACDHDTRHASYEASGNMTGRAVRWKRNKRTKKFVELYKKYECLWNFRSNAYKQRHLRDEAYEAIASEMRDPDFDVEGVKKKIRIIRNTYMQELQKIERSKLNGCGDEGVYVPTLSWFKCADSFMRDIVSQKRSASKPGEGEYYEVNGSQARVKEEIEDPEMDSSSHMYTFVPETHFEGSEQTASVYVPETSFETSDQSIKLVNHSKTKSKHSQEQKQLENSEQRISNAIDELREISKSVNSTKTEDEFDIFGRSVAAQLRQLPLMEALSIQLKLQMTLTEARIKASQNESE